MNNYIEHVLVIPEDEADEQVANGFVLNDRVDDRRVQVMPVARGWSNVLKTFEDEYISYLRKYPLGQVVMLIDFDGQHEARMNRFREAIPDDLKDRVFVVGSSENPEMLKAALKVPRLEDIGRRLAEDCAVGPGGLWDHEQLKHNAEERKRLEISVQKFVLP
ncbi:MAG: hypothetical protein SFX72_11555 [Isosphaeraceae bacterium]|nr:hypothetical protein [Isosphaeraceae bacterium]